MEYKNDIVFLKIFGLEITYYQLFKFSFYSFLAGCIAGSAFFLIFGH
jgi:hypothetical protein